MMNKKKLTALFLLLLFASYPTNAQNIDSLRQKITRLISKKSAVVGVAIMGKDGQDTLSVLGTQRFPMQSVFKFHIALAMLAEIDKGKFSLDQKIKIRKKELLPGLWSPIREKYPQGAQLSIAEILSYTVSQSDNVGCDVLLRLLGKPTSVEAYIKKQDIQDISIKINEEVMQNNWDLQFDNWTTPKAANAVLEKFLKNKSNLLSSKSHKFIWDIMQETSTGMKRIKGKLPAGTTIAHKTGWSGKHKTTGITAAVNDIGVVYLPNGDYFFISIFVSASKEDFDTNEEIIADIAKVTWDYFYQKTKN